MSQQKYIDVTALEPRLKHPTIFDAFDSIDSGDMVVIHNDHDPKPLYYQLLGERGNCFSWTYLENGPEIWKVEIKKNVEDHEVETLGSIAAKDLRKAEVFKKMGLDYCCGGKKTLEVACAEKGLDVIRVQEELTKAEQNNNKQHDFNSWKLSFLIDYIITIHHSYVNESALILKDLSEKVANHHSASHPYLAKVHEKVIKLLCELDAHMKKEEQIVFPYIKSIEKPDMLSIQSFKSAKDPIAVMLCEHETAGEILQEIRSITSDYTPPENSCNSIRLLMYKLQEFESDLLTHIHLENNILFPKTLKLEEEEKQQKHN